MEAVGRVSLWRYTENERNYPGWNLNADAAGCRSLLELLDALTITGAGGRTVTVTQPTSEQHVGRNSVAPSLDYARHVGGPRGPGTSAGVLMSAFDPKRTFGIRLA